LSGLLPMPAMQFKDQGHKLTGPLAIYLGKGVRVTPGRHIVIGDCAVSESGQGGNVVPGCPPEKREIIRRLAYYPERAK